MPRSLMKAILQKPVNKMNLEKNTTALLMRGAAIKPDNAPW